MLGLLRTLTTTVCGLGLAGTLACAYAAGTDSPTRNDIPSCYAWANLDAQQPAPSGRELVVIIDQTVYLNDALQRTAWGHIVRTLRPGDAVRLYQFSAFLEDHYLRLPFVGRLEAPLASKARNRIGANSLKQLDACLAQQVTFFQENFGKQFAASFAAPDTNIARSDILASLQKIASDLTAHTEGSAVVTDRIILLVSDMLENSSLTSFYRAGRVRDIDPTAEMKKAQSLVADFDGARVYVHGAGLVGGKAAGSYRAGDTLRKLEQFWREYLTQSNARLQAFGTPELTMELR